MTPAKFRTEPCPRCGTPQSVINGQWLRHRRERAGLSLLEMGRRIGVSAPFLCDIEHDRRNCLPYVRAGYDSLSQGVA